MLRRLSLAAILLLGGREIAGSRQQPSTARTLQGSLASPVGSYSVDADSTLVALIKVATDFKLPMGIEWIKRGGVVVRYNHSWQVTTVSTIIQDIVASLPGYEVDSTGTRSVLHVRPSAFQVDNGDIVNAHVGLFQVKNELVEVASRRLQRLAGTIVMPREASQSPGGVAGSVGTGVDDQKVTFTIEDGTVRDILDRLCLAAGLKIWIVAYPAVATRTPAGFLRTASLYNDLPIEDRWQPTWNLLPWGTPRDLK
ncbi:MAG: hypothetical protein JO340_05860 [Acidobacteriaceae bacterium]|nr:hypothetical protein [Acidobacteriaceae bacterium]